MKSKLIIDGNSVYEIDEECIRKKEEDERNKNKPLRNVNRNRKRKR